MWIPGLPPSLSSNSPTKLNLSKIFTASDRAKNSLQASCCTFCKPPFLHQSDQKFPRAAMAVQRGIAPIFKAPPRIEIILFPQRCWHCQICQKMLYKIDVALFQKSPFPSPGCQKMPTWLQSSVPGGNYPVWERFWYSQNRQKLLYKIAVVHF